jgi:hypothetical protein
VHARIAVAQNLLCKQRRRTVRVCTPVPVWGVLGCGVEPGLSAWCVLPMKGGCMCCVSQAAVLCCPAHHSCRILQDFVCVWVPGCVCVCTPNWLASCTISPIVPDASVVLQALSVAVKERHAA